MNNDAGNLLQDLLPPGPLPGGEGTTASRTYWKSPEERGDTPEFQQATANEFAEEIPTRPATPSRRDFLAAAGFALAGMTMAGCSRPPQRVALPMVNQPPEVTPGRAMHYASTCQACGSGCGVLVKTRDGRPIKLEGNPEHALTRGGLCAVGQASLLGLYDRLRFQHPLRNGEQSTWREVDAEIRGRLDEIRRNNGAVRVLSGSIVSPTLRAQIHAFLGGFRNGRHVVYDPLSSTAISDAHLQTHGVRVLPHYRLEQAEVIVSFDADFLGTWISPVEFTRTYHEGRNLAGDPPRCSFHVQFESRLSLTGAKADERHRVLPGEIGLLLTHLARRLAERGGTPWTGGMPEDAPALATVLDGLARRLWDARGRSLVLCGSQDVAAQMVCNLINHLLGNYGATIDLQRPSYQRQGNDAELERLVQELRDDSIAALFVLDSNPVYNLPASVDWNAVLGRVPLLVVCAERPDETTRLAKIVCPHPHYLASWGDAEAVRGTFSLAQPTFRPLGSVRSILESFAAWSGEAKSARQLVQDHWRARVFPLQTRERHFEAFWDRAVHDGFVEATIAPEAAPAFNPGVVQPVLRAARPAEGSFALALYPKVGLLDGTHAYNPWLQEMPDPISKVAWDNYVCISPAAAATLDIRDGDQVRIEADGVSLEAPALIQPGQHDQALAIALGYGSKLSERFANVGPTWLEARPTLNENGVVGVNAASFVKFENHTLRFNQPSIRVTKTGRQHPLAATQQHHTITVPAHLAPPGHRRRLLVQETTVARLGAAPGEHLPHADLWPEDHPTTGHRWVMVIDLAACTGCSACVVACQVENNVPVVGKDEVRRQREMHWLRIDRYYSEDGVEDGNIDVAFQPMLCQHCGNAPCETVCPVLATVHSSEGLNQQVYNRCVGTRYCANNCPYKVRRFNWFDYPREDALHNLVLNPDVTVRSRGVMEKCTFCVQRIQEAKIEARRLGLPLADGTLQTACQQSCPAQAIVFGDLNDPESKVSRLIRDGRSYQVLAELNVRPSVHYLKIVRNRAAAEGGRHD